MNAWRKGYLGTMLAVVLVLGALLGACGTDSPSGKTVTTVSGVVTAGTPTVGLMTCTSCHPTETANWMQTKHANVYPNGNLNSQGSPTLGQIYTNGVFTDPVTSPAVCKNCHDSNGDGAGNSFTANYTGNVPRPVVGCESCHSGGQLHADQGGVGPISYATATAMVIGTTSTVQASAQFRTCTGCHELLDPADPASKATATHAPLGSAPTGSAYIITDTHFATAGTYDSGGTRTAPLADISGYAMDFGSEKVCSNCHQPHGTADINREWAASGMGDLTASPWKRYNWSCDGSDRLTCGPSSTSLPPADRRFCQRCHTTTGYVAFANALAQGNTSLADSLQLGLTSAITFTAGWKAEMLKCDGCHTDNRGSIRNPGAFNVTYYYRVRPAGTPSGTPEVIYASASYQFPDAGASNVCILCHSGRNSGLTIPVLNTAQAPTTVNFANFSLSDAHDFFGGAVVLKGFGYEFQDRGYDNPASFRHDRIGTAEVPNTGDLGPCVGCHMYRSGASANHLFMPVNTSPTGTVLTVSSEVCFNCHAGSSSSLALVVEDERLNLIDARSALEAQLKAVGLLSSSGSPTTNWGSPDEIAKNNLGAAYNSRSLRNDPGAYVHNSKYVKRLLYDSYDWADDQQMNYTVGSTLTTACTTLPQTWCARAINYLLPNGVAPGVSAERPY